MVLVNEIEMKQKYNEICNLYRTPYDLCVKCLESFPSKRNPDIVKLIKSYLNDLIGLVDLISRIKSSQHFDQVNMCLLIDLCVDLVIKEHIFHFY